MAKNLFRQLFLAVGDDRHGRSEDMEQLAVGNVNDPDEAGNDVEVPEEVGIDSYLSQEMR
jgi:hypothetical protein